MSNCTPQTILIDKKYVSLKNVNPKLAGEIEAMRMNLDSEGDH